MSPYVQRMYVYFLKQNGIVRNMFRDKDCFIFEIEHTYEKFDGYGVIKNLSLSDEYCFIRSARSDLYDITVSSWDGYGLPEYRMAYSTIYPDYMAW
jgi:hypothetical protein